LPTRASAHSGLHVFVLLPWGTGPPLPGQP
jgi:hypothetical protein